MACPTCDHTMESLGEFAGRRHFRCPRCGTLRTVDPTGYTVDYRPKLVDRCRKFEAWCAAGHGLRDTNVCREWTSLGIAESINPPEQRS